MNSKTALWVALISICMVASNSFALHELFKHVDENKDEKITREEFSKDMKENAFEKIDNSQDKMVSKSEWMSLGDIVETEKHDRLFKEIDRDKDSRITFFEFSDYADKHSNIYEAFMGLDKNGSNALSPDELTVRPLFKMITIRF